MRTACFCMAHWKSMSGSDLLCTGRQPSNSESHRSVLENGIVNAGAVGGRIQGVGDLAVDRLVRALRDPLTAGPGQGGVGGAPAAGGRRARHPPPRSTSCWTPTCAARPGASVCMRPFWRLAHPGPAQQGCICMHAPVLASGPPWVLLSRATSACMHATLLPSAQ